MNDIVFLDENINLFCIRITKIGNIYFRFSVNVVFHKLHYHIIFVVMTACNTVTESVCRQLHRKVSTKTGVTEIKFRCFAEPFQFIVWIWGKQINNVKSHKYFQSFLCGTWCNISGFRKSRIIDLLWNKSSTTDKKLTKTNCVGDTAVLA